MRYSCALALIVALSLAVSSEGFRLKRQAGDSKHIAEVNFQQQQQDAEDTEGPSFAQVMSSDNVSNVSIKVACGERVSNTAWKNKRDFVVQLWLNGRTAWCPGTISGDMVITNRHCVKDKAISTITVKTAYKSGIKVIKKYIHPSHDVAMLRLESVQTTHRRMRLSPKPLLDGLSVRLCGFGATESMPHGTLHDTGHLKVFSSCTSDPFIACATSGSSSCTSTCGGDSGSPWFRYSSSTETFYVVGVNFGGGGGGGSGCGSKSKYSAMVRTEKIESWVKSITSRFYWAKHVG